MRGRLVTIVCVTALLAAGCSSGSRSKDAAPIAFPNVVDLRAKTTGAYPEVDVASNDIGDMPQICFRPAACEEPSPKPPAVGPFLAQRPAPLRRARC